jgi:hypothetical protein
LIKHSFVITYTIVNIFFSNLKGKIFRKQIYIAQAEHTLYESIAINFADKP